MYRVYFCRDFKGLVFVVIVSKTVNAGKKKAKEG